MSKQYVIEVTHSWNKKDGTPVISKSYFQRFVTIVFPMISLSSLEDCKKYQTKADALCDWRKYYNNSRAKVVDVKTIKQLV